METAGHLGFENADWHNEIYLREQDLGILGGTSAQQREHQEAEMERRNRDVFYWAPPGGESVADCTVRVELFLSELRRTASGLRVLVVGHGNIIKAIRIRLERLLQSDWVKLNTSPDYATYNGQVIWYSRRNPFNSKIESSLSWVKSTCPWDTSKGHDWKRVSRHTLSNEELLNIVNETPRIVDNKSFVATLSTN